LWIGFSHSTREKTFKTPEYVFVSPPITSSGGLEFSPTVGDAIRYPNPILHVFLIASRNHKNSHIYSVVFTMKNVFLTKNIFCSLFVNPKFHKFLSEID
jgi:hypothetical protein